MASVASAPTTGFNNQPPSGLKGEPQPGLLFDVFYEELLTQLMESGELQEKIPTEFMQLQSDLQRVEYLIQLRPIVRDFRIKSKQTKSLKSLEKSTKHREEGNKLFQNEKTAQDTKGNIYSLEMALTPSLAFDVENDVSSVDGQDDMWNYRLTFTHPPRTNKATLMDGLTSDVAFVKANMQDKLKDKVRRNNNLVVEIQGAVTITKK